MSVHIKICLEKGADSSLRTHQSFGVHSTSRFCMRLFHYLRDWVLYIRTRGCIKLLSSWSNSRPATSSKSIMMDFTWSSYLRISTPSGMQPFYFMFSRLPAFFEDQKVGDVGRNVQFCGDGSPPGQHCWQYRGSIINPP
jgi:hypothetical protein